MPVDYHAWTHRPKALGGTDPLDIPGAVESAIFFGWNFDTNNLIPANTLTTLCNGSNDSYFETYWLSHPSSSPSWLLDFDEGVIRKDESAHYKATCDVRFSDDFDADDFVGVCIDIGNVGFFSSRRVWNWYQDPDNALYGEYLYGAADWFGNATFRVSVYHNHSTSVALTDAQFYVAKMPTTEADGETFQRP